MLIVRKAAKITRITGTYKEVEILLVKQDNKEIKEMIIDYRKHQEETHPRDCSGEGHTTGHHIGILANGIRILNQGPTDYKSSLMWR